MEKLNLHESLRIYIPGLLLSMQLYILFQEKFTGLSNIAVPAIFIGFAINAPLYILSNRYFKRIINNYKINFTEIKEYFHEHLKSILSSKYSLLHPTLTNPFYTINITNKKIWETIVFKHYAKIYDSPDLSNIRLPKSFGVMYFNLFAVSITTPIIFLTIQPFTDVRLSKLHILIISLSFIIGVSFFISSQSFFKKSLKNELLYWDVISDEEFERIVESFKLYPLNITISIESKKKKENRLISFLKGTGKAFLLIDD